MFTKQQQEIVAAPGISAERLAERVVALEKAYSELQKAFDSLFDVVVEELGYEAATWESFNQWQREFVRYKYSPRRLAMTQPEPEIIRTKAKGA